MLFRRKNAPSRNVEDDFYWADKHLGPNEKLPDSELLKAVHTFAADYYSRTAQDGGRSDSRTMDGTALLALGILLEEAVTQVLGKKGDMVFVEGEPTEAVSEEDQQTLPSRSGSRPSTRSSKVASQFPSTRIRSRKRPRRDHGTSE